MFVYNRVEREAQSDSDSVKDLETASSGYSADRDFQLQLQRILLFNGKNYCKLRYGADESLAGNECIAVAVSEL